MVSRAEADDLPPPPPQRPLPEWSETAPPSGPLPRAPEVPLRDASDEPPVLLEVGARFAYAHAIGDYADGVSLGTPPIARVLPAWDSALPLTAEVGARIDRVAYLGIAYQYAPLLAQCPFDVGPGVRGRCGGYDIRVSLQARFHAAPRAIVDPWVGAGIGYEWLSTLIDASDDTGTSVHSGQVFQGWNLLDLSAGLDVHATPSLIIGPYVELTSGVYTSDAGRPKDPNNIFDFGSLFGDDIARTSSHQWIAIGIRGAYVVGARDR